MNVPLSEPQHEASLLVFQDRLTNREIAGKLGISLRTLDNWKALPEFQKALERHSKRWQEFVLTKGIGDLRRRLYRKNDRWRRIQSIVEERAAHPDMQDVPGGRSGFLAKTTRTIRIDKETWQKIDEYEFDKGLNDALSDLEREAAMELGQWKQKLEVTTLQVDATAQALAEALSPDELQALYLKLSEAQVRTGLNPSSA